MPNLEYVRGDTAPQRFSLLKGGVAFDLTGFTVIKLTLTVEKTGTVSIPAPTFVAEFDGALTGTPTDGIIAYVPDLAGEATIEDASDLLVPGKYNCSVRGINAATLEQTLLDQEKFHILEAKTTDET